VDDEPRFAQTLQILLAMDHDVEVIQDAREALVRLRDGVSYDAILCDLMMAEMSGMQLHEELSRVAPEQARRIIFMTGGAFAQSARDFLARVPNPRLLKPFDPRELEELLAALFL
jgi:CheY-like chemotaxis protein